MNRIDGNVDDVLLFDHYLTRKCSFLKVFFISMGLFFYDRTLKAEKINNRERTNFSKKPSLNKVNLRNFKLINISLHMGFFSDSRWLFNKNIYLGLCSSITIMTL